MKTREQRLAWAAFLAFRYIGDRSAGSSEAWEALATALDEDAEEATTEEMLRALDALSRKPGT